MDALLYVRDGDGPLQCVGPVVAADFKAKAAEQAKVAAAGRQVFLVPLLQYAEFGTGAARTTLTEKAGTRATLAEA